MKRNVQGIINAVYAVVGEQDGYVTGLVENLRDKQKAHAVAKEAWHNATEKFASSPYNGTYEYNLVCEKLIAARDDVDCVLSQIVRYAAEKYPDKFMLDNFDAYYALRLEKQLDDYFPKLANKEKLWGTENEAISIFVDSLGTCFKNLHFKYVVGDFDCFEHRYSVLKTLWRLSDAELEYNFSPYHTNGFQDYYDNMLAILLNPQCKFELKNILRDRYLAALSCN